MGEARNSLSLHDRYDLYIVSHMVDDQLQRRRELYFKLNSEIAQIDNARLHTLFEKSETQSSYGTPIEIQLTGLVEKWSPDAFVYIDDADGSSQFYTAGFADLATQSPMTLDSHFRIGSTTKTFTAVVTLQLVAEGRLSLQDTLQGLLPDLPIPNARELTVEHLLRMRNGSFGFRQLTDPSLARHLRSVPEVRSLIYC